MAEMRIISTHKKKEKVLLIAVQTDSASDADSSLKELEFLAETAGADTVGKMIQRLENMHPGTYIGKGKIDELRRLIDDTHADTVIADDELSPAQMKNLADALAIKVIDRTVLILDIFAAHAVTSEGRIQVETAQLRYALTRLQGYGAGMSRLGGGIGTRGPGESRLETDRRRIRVRISQLKKELTDIEKHRAVTRQGRQKAQIPVIALVGYTNAGKSSLLNRLTGAGVLSENKLFATLDPTTRSCTLPGGQKVLFTDTVGFINKLPHHLVDAFRSTLEEAKYADLILHVADASDSDIALKMKVTHDTLHFLEADQKTIITVFNKCDQLNVPEILHDPLSQKSLRLSALTGEGIPELLDLVEAELKEKLFYIEKSLDFSEAARVQRIRKEGQLLEETYTENGIYIRAYIPQNMKGEL